MRTWLEKQMKNAKTSRKQNKNAKRSKLKHTQTMGLQQCSHLKMRACVRKWLGQTAKKNVRLSAELEEHTRRSQTLGAEETQCPTKKRSKACMRNWKNEKTRKNDKKRFRGPSTTEKKSNQVLWPARLACSQVRARLKLTVSRQHHCASEVRYWSFHHISWVTDSCAGLRLAVTLSGTKVDLLKQSHAKPTKEVSVAGLRAQKTATLTCTSQHSAQATRRSGLMPTLAAK